MRRILKFALRVSLALLFLLVAAELALRTLGFGNQVIVARDGDCSYYPAPNQHTRRFFAENSINEFGLRSAPITRQKPAGTFRAMFVGDSITYGTTYVDQKLIFTSLLQNQLPAQTGRKIEILNASCGAWAVENELGYLRGHGTFDSDVVVLVINTSDLMQHLSILVEGDVNYPTERPTLALGEALDRYLLPRITGRYAPKSDAGSHASDLDTPANVPHILSKIGETRELATAHGAAFAVLYVPFRASEFQAPMYVEAAAKLVDWCRESKTKLVDMTEDFNPYPADATHIQGVHLKPQGHAIIAARLERELFSP